MNPYRNESFGWRGPRGSYYGRGNVKFVILDLLKEKPRHGYDIIREMEERSGGVYTPSPGVIYPTLQALEDQDYVKSAEQDGKKVYSITESGEAYLQGHQERQGQGGRRGPGFGPGCGPAFGPGAGHGPAWHHGRPGGEAGAERQAAAAAGDAPGGATDETGAQAGQTGSRQAPRGEGPHGPEGPNWIPGGPGGPGGSGRHGHRSRGPQGAAWGSWFASSGGPEMMREMRWLFGDFATAIQRTLGDRQKLDEIRAVLREAKAKIDEIVMRQD